MMGNPSYMPQVIPLANAMPVTTPQMGFNLF
jgi:hypothetical protein